MRIKRKFQGFVPAGKILDLPSKSKADTYSCNKINEMSEHEVVLFDGVLISNTPLNIDMTPYKRLLITFQTYYYTDENTGGTSNVLTLDLTTTANNTSMYISGMLVPYTPGNQFQGTMWCQCKVNHAKTSITALVGFGTDVQSSDAYCVKRIVGVK